MMPAIQMSLALIEGKSICTSNDAINGDVCSCGNSDWRIAGWIEMIKIVVDRGWQVSGLGDTSLNNIFVREFCIITYTCNSTYIHVKKNVENRREKVRETSHLLMESTKKIP